MPSSMHCRPVKTPPSTPLPRSPTHLHHQHPPPASTTTVVHQGTSFVDLHHRGASSFELNHQGASSVVINHQGDLGLRVPRPSSSITGCKI